MVIFFRNMAAWEVEAKKHWLKLLIKTINFWKLVIHSKYRHQGVWQIDARSEIMKYVSELVGNTKPPFCSKNAGSSDFRGIHCVKMFGSRSFSGPYSVQMWENMDQKNSKYGDYLRNNCLISELKQPEQQLRWIFFL